jgi:hypothetical protein
VSCSSSGAKYLKAFVQQTRTSQADQINTVVLAANVDGLASAVRRGFVGTARNDVDGVTFIDLTLQDPIAWAPATAGCSRKV